MAGFAAQNVAAAPRQLKMTYLADSKVLLLKWSGKIDRPMARQLASALALYADQTRRIVLTLNSGGGRVTEAKKVIRTLRRWKRAHRLDTNVMPGRICGSMCVPIFLQGQNRTASKASLWLFHEISTRDRTTGRTIRLRPKKTARMFSDFFIPAGVSRQWLDQITAKIRGNDIWLTGAELAGGPSRIITSLSSNARRRKVYRRFISLKNHPGL